MFRRKIRSASDLKLAVIEALLVPEWLENVLIGKQGDVTRIVRADPENLLEAETRRLIAESAIQSVAGATSVIAVLTAERVLPPGARPGGKVRHALRDTSLS